MPRPRRYNRKSQCRLATLKKAIAKSATKRQRGKLLADYKKCCRKPVQYSESYNTLKAKKDSIDINTLELYPLKPYDFLSSADISTLEEQVDMSLIEDINIPQFDPNEVEPLDAQFITADPPRVRPNTVYDPFPVNGVFPNTEPLTQGITQLQPNHHVESSRNIGRRTSHYSEYLEKFPFIEGMNEKQQEEFDRFLSENGNIKGIVKNLKATKLVKKWLTEAEWNELISEHKVTIQSKKYAGRIYVVYEDPYKKVEVLKRRKVVKNKSRLSFKKKEEEFVVTPEFRLCGYVSGESFPEGDQLLAKIMAIKGNEDYYIEHSNIY